jgi:iron complex transport system substrate-binding protein
MGSGIMVENINHPIQAMGWFYVLTRGVEMKSARILFSSVLIGFLIVGCSTYNPDVTPTLSVGEIITLTDGLDRQVSLQVPAMRIVSLAPSNTELLYETGAGAQVVGRDSFSNYPAEAARIQDIGGSMGQYNYEAITALEPDLVLAAEINTPEQVRSLEELGLTVYYLSNPVDFDGLYRNISLVGKLSGHDQECTELVSALSGRVKKLEMKLAGVTTRPSVYYELDATDPALPYTIGTGTFGDYLITRAGGTNLGALIGAGWVQISAEEILQRNPDLILLGDVYYGVNPETVAARPGWGVLDAVKNGKVIPFNDDLMSRPTARLIDGLEALAALIHPEIYQYP